VATGPAEQRTNYERFLAEQLADPEFRQLYEEAVSQDLSLQFVLARKAAGLTQAEVAERMRTSQPQVARIESDGYDSATLRTLKRYADAVGKKLVIELR
jgi:ribosome-binding protein aMBF1 (putative translation factor)